MAEPENTGGGDEKQPLAATPEASAPSEPAPPAQKSNPTILQRVGSAAMTVPKRVIGGAGAARELPGDIWDIARSPFTKESDMMESIIAGASHAASVAGAAEAIANPGGVTARAAAREARDAIRDGIKNAFHPHPETPPQTALASPPPAATEPTIAVAKEGPVPPTTDAQSPSVAPVPEKLSALKDAVLAAGLHNTGAQLTQSSFTNGAPSSGGPRQVG